MAALQGAREGVPAWRMTRSRAAVMPPMGHGEGAISRGYLRWRVVSAGGRSALSRLAARARLGLPRRLATAGGGGRKAAWSAGAAAVREACGIAGFLTVYLTDMVVILGRGDKQFHSAATVWSVPHTRRRKD
jgi:hypothetical protein